MENVIAWLNAAGSALAAVVQITPEVTALAQEVGAVITGSTDPTDAQWAALHAVQAQNTAALNAPMQGETLPDPGTADT